MRMLMNNLDPEVAENPAELVVYGGRGKGPFRWVALSGDPEDIARTDEKGQGTAAGRRGIAPLAGHACAAAN